MLIAFIVILGLSLLILGHEAGHFLVSKMFGLKVDEFGFGFPPRIVAKKIGETEYSLNWLPFGGFVKIAGENGEFALQAEDTTGIGKERIFLFQPAWKRALVIAAGVIINFIIGWFLLSAVFMIGTPQAVLITGIQDNSPAAAAGIKSGDVLSGYQTSAEFISFVNAHRGETVTLSVKRGSENLSFTMTPRVVTAPNEGALGVLLGDAGTPKHSLLDALSDGLTTTWTIAVLTLQGLGALITNLFIHAQVSNDVVGPVGIFGVAQDAGQLGLIYLVQLISLISINLAVVNLLPFPALDGGRLFLILIEKLKGSPVSQKTEAYINGFGFVFLVFLMVVITFHDITKLFS